MPTVIEMEPIYGPYPMRVGGDQLEDAHRIVDGAGNVFTCFKVHLGNDTYLKVFKNLNIETQRPEDEATFIPSDDPYQTTPRKAMDINAALEGSDIVAIGASYERPPEGAAQRNHYIELGRWESIAVPLAGGVSGELRPLPSPGGQAFIDMPPDATFFAEVNILHRMGAIGGYGDGTFRPNNVMTRGQACKVIVGALRYLLGRS